MQTLGSNVQRKGTFGFSTAYRLYKPTENVIETVLSFPLQS